MASPDLSTDDVRGLLKSGVLEEAESTNVVTAVTDYRAYGNLPCWIIGGIVLAFMLMLA